MLLVKVVDRLQGHRDHRNRGNASKILVSGGLVWSVASKPWVRKEFSLLLTRSTERERPIRA